MVCNAKIRQGRSAEEPLLELDRVAASRRPVQLQGGCHYFQISDTYDNNSVERLDNCSGVALHTNYSTRVTTRSHVQQRGAINRTHGTTHRQAITTRPRTHIGRPDMAAARAARPLATPEDALSVDGGTVAEGEASAPPEPTPP